MAGHVFIANGDITRLSADVVGFSASTNLTADGHLYSAFAQHVAGFAEQFKALPRPCQVGDAFWLPQAGGGRPLGVVVVAAAGGLTLSREKKIRRAVRNCLESAVGQVGPTEAGRSRPLIALPTFRRGLGGDRSWRLASARLQVRTAHEFLQAHPDVDVAFVAYTADSYRVFLQARREEGLAPISPVPAEAVADLVGAVREHRCVLFAGAGLSAGAGLPDWAELVGRLAEELGVADAGSADVDQSLDLAQWYMEAHGREALGRRVSELFAAGGSRPTLAHYLLLSLPVRLVLTTNFDDLLEQTLTGLRRYATAVVDEKDVVRTGEAEGVFVVKLHGDARRAEGMVLCRDDYESFFRQRPALAVLLEALLLNQTFLFVGYGLKDPNFRQIHSRIAAILEEAKRQAFALTVEGYSSAQALLAGQWDRKGVRLVAMPGGSLEERVRASWVFLDWLADEAAQHGPSLFLARDVPDAGRLSALRRVLIEGVGKAVEEAFQGPLEEGEARLLADVLAFLVRHGWQADPGSGTHTWRLWAALAAAVADPRDKRRLLAAALGHAERFADVTRILDALKELEDPS